MLALVLGKILRRMAASIGATEVIVLSPETNSDERKWNVLLHERGGVKPANSDEMENFLAKKQAAGNALKGLLSDLKDIKGGTVISIPDSKDADGHQQFCCIRLMLLDLTDLPIAMCFILRSDSKESARSAIDSLRFV